MKRLGTQSQISKSGNGFQISKTELMARTQPPKLPKTPR